MCCSSQTAFNKFDDVAALLFPGLGKQGEQFDIAAFFSPLADKRTGLALQYVVCAKQANTGVECQLGRIGGFRSGRVMGRGSVRSVSFGIYMGMGMG